MKVLHLHPKRELRLHDELESVQVAGEVLL